MSSNRSYPSGWICSNPGLQPTGPGGFDVFHEQRNGKVQTSRQKHRQHGPDELAVVGRIGAGSSSCCPRWMSAPLRLNSSGSLKGADAEWSCIRHEGFELLSVPVGQRQRHARNRILHLSRLAGIRSLSRYLATRRRFYSNDGIFFMNSEISDRLYQERHDLDDSVRRIAIRVLGRFVELLRLRAVPGDGDELAGPNIARDSETPARAQIDWMSGQNSASNLSEITLLSQTGASGNFLVFGFGSPHTEVVMFCMCDGSSRAINKSINPIVMSALATRDTGERISDDF